MQTANKKSTSLKIKPFLFSIILATSVVALSACSSNRLKITKNFKESPDASRTGMTDAIGCMGKTLKKENSNTAYIFMVRDIIDGTITNRTYQNSPLSDAGRIQMINVLSDHVYPQIGLVTDRFPTTFSQTVNETVGLNRFGLPSLKNQQAFMMSYASIIQNSRKGKGLPPASNIVPLVITGAFTRFDSDNIKQKGSGHNLGSRSRRLAENETDSIWKKTSGQVDIGHTLSAKAISLVINLVDPRNNLVVSSQSLDLIFYRKNKTFRLRIGVGEGYYGISRNEVEVEGTHGAQKVLIDAAALWLINKAYGRENKFSSCFTAKQKQITMTPAQVGQINKKIRAKQDAIVRKSMIKKQEKQVKSLFEPQNN